MKVLGVALRRPGFDDLTIVAVSATAFLVVAIALMNVAGHAPTQVDKTLILLGGAWGGLSQKIGIGVFDGWRPFLLNLAGTMIAAGLVLCIAALLS